MGNSFCQPKTPSEGWGNCFRRKAGLAPSGGDVGARVELSVHGHAASARGNAGSVLLLNAFLLSLKYLQYLKGYMKTLAITKANLLSSMCARS